MPKYTLIKIDIAPSLYFLLQDYKRRKKTDLKMFYQAAVIASFEKIIRKGFGRSYFFPSYLDGQELNIYVNVHMFRLIKIIAKKYHISIASFVFTAFMRHCEREGLCVYL